MRTKHTAHLRNDTFRDDTACGEPWQGWQAPDDYDGPIVPPLSLPQPFKERIEQCPQCLKIALDTRFPEVESG